MLRLILIAIGWGLAGFVALPVVVFAGLLVFVAFDPVCGSPGDSGGCYMGLAAITFAAAPVGFAAATIVALIHGLTHRRRADG